MPYITQELGGILGKERLLEPGHPQMAATHPAHYMMLVHPNLSSLCMQVV